MTCKEAMKVIFKDLYYLNCDSLRVLFFFDVHVARGRD